MGKHTEEFKESIVNLYRSGKSSGELMRQYGIVSSTFYKWVKKYSEVRISETETVSMKEIKEMQKRLAQLEEENMIHGIASNSQKTISIFSKE